MANVFVREIWFRCSSCGRESYCDSSFEGDPEAKVLCPFCGLVMRLSEARLT